MNLKKLKIAIVCDWLTTSGGAEKVILRLHQLFPEAPIYTSVYNPDKVKGLEKAKIITSYLQSLPLARKKHQYFLSLLPKIFESFDFSEYDLVISSSHSCAKGIITNPGTLHICYCHSPMRYAWEDNQQYVSSYNMSSLIKLFVPFFIHKIRQWDKLTADRVDHFIANSNYVKNRIHKYYRRNSDVIYPFIHANNFQPGTQREDFFLAVGRITSYKKFDLLVEAFNKTNYKLKIAGTGNSMPALSKIANSNIEFLGFVSDKELKELYQKAKALIFPQCEDFGIIPLEAMASGCPVIAFKKGGALETIKDQTTGVFFEEQTTSSLIDALQKFNNLTFNSNEIVKHARKFDVSEFDDKLTTLIKNIYESV